MSLSKSWGDRQGDGVIRPSWSWCHQQRRGWELVCPSSWGAAGGVSHPVIGGGGGKGVSHPMSHPISHHVQNEVSYSVSHHPRLVVWSRVPYPISHPPRR